MKRSLNLIPLGMNSALILPNEVSVIYSQSKIKCKVQDGQRRETVNNSGEGRSNTNITL